jgi:hypothetical protein
MSHANRRLRHVGVGHPTSGRFVDKISLFSMHLVRAAPT